MITGHLLSQQQGLRSSELESAVLAPEVASGAVQALFHCVRLDVEHGGGFGDGELFPCHQTEHLDVGVGQPGGGGEDEAVLGAVDHRLVGGGRGSARHRVQSVLEPPSPGRAPPLVSDHPKGDPVQPHQRLGAGGDVLEAAPSGEERLGDGVVHQIGGHTSTAEVADRSVVATVELVEHGVLGRVHERCGVRPLAHDK